MPAARSLERGVHVLITVALAFALAGLAPRGAGAQSATPGAPSKPGAGIFPLTNAWLVRLDTAPALPPAYDEAHAYIVLKPDPDRGIASMRLTAVALSNGSTIWTREIAAVETIAAGENLLFACAGSRLDAFSTSDGAPKWQATLAAPPSAPLLVAGGWLVAATQGSDVVAFRAADGTKMWQAHLSSPATGKPAVTGDGLYLPLTDNRVVRLKLDSGAVVWDQQILTQPSSVLALDDRIFVGTRQRWFYALAPKSGRVQWRFPIGGSVVGTPAADSARVYFLTLDNQLRALDRSGGPLQWRRILARRERFGPFQAADLLFVSGLSPTVAAFDAASGAPAGSFDAPKDLNMSVHVVHGLVEVDFLLIALTGEGELLAMRPQALQPEPFVVSPQALLLTGFPIWRY